MGNSSTSIGFSMGVYLTQQVSHVGLAPIVLWKPIPDGLLVMTLPSLPNLFIPSTNLSNFDEVAIVQSGGYT